MRLHFVYVCSLAVALLLFVVSENAAIPIPHSSHSSYPLHATYSHHFPDTLTRLAFGSCNQQYKPQPLWSSMSAVHPQLFVFLGDVVYADRFLTFLPFIRWAAAPPHIQQQFSIQLKNRDYQQFLSSHPIIGIWDDHDFGENDGNIHSPNKAEIQQLFLDFLQESTAEIRRRRKGLYTSYTAGPPNQRVKIILLDTRYHQSTDTDDMLGEEQWEWLTAQLNYQQNNNNNNHHRYSIEEGLYEYDDDNSTEVHPPDLLIIASSIQLVAHNRRIGEGWRHFPQSRYRLFSLLSQLPTKTAVLFLSGDVHYAEIVRSDYCTNTSNSITIHPLIDVTSSGLTHAIGRQIPYLADALMPSILGKPLISLTKSTKQQQHQPYTGMDQLCTNLNYGLIEIDWVSRMVTVQILGLNNSICIKTNYRFTDLAATTYPLTAVDAAFPDLTSHPLSNSSATLSAALRRCQYEYMERDQYHWSISGIKAGICLLIIILCLLLFILYLVVILINGCIRKLRNFFFKQKKQQ